MHDTLRDIIAAAKESSLKYGRCPFVLHEKPGRITKQARDAKEHHCQVLPARLSRLFAEARQRAMTADADLFKGYAPEELPGLHEVRALASFLLKEQGADTREVMELMAHTAESMTEHYQRGHREDWREITLKLSV